MNFSDCNHLSCFCTYSATSDDYTVSVICSDFFSGIPFLLDLFGVSLFLVCLLPFCTYVELFEHFSSLVHLISFHKSSSIYSCVKYSRFICTIGFSIEEGNMIPAFSGWREKRSNQERCVCSQDRANRKVSQCRHL